MADRIDVYAQALLDIVSAEGHLDEVEDELFRFARIVEGNDDLRMTLANPGLPLDRRAGDRRRAAREPGAADHARDRDVHRRRGRGHDLPAIVDRFVELAAQTREHAVAEVRSAVALDDAQRQRIADALSPGDRQAGRGEGDRRRVGARRHRRDDRRHGDRRHGPSPSRPVEGADLNGRADDRRRRHRGRPAQERRGLPARRSRASRSAGCSRSATASRASPACPNAAVNELLEFEGGALGLALNLEEDNDRRGGARQGRRGGRGPARHRDRPHPLDPGRQRAARSRRERARRRDRRQGPDPAGRAAPPRDPGARHHRPQAGARAAADRHQGHRRDDADRPRPARAHHRRPQDRQDHGRDRHDPEPKGSGREVHLRRDRAEGLHRRADGRDAARARRARVHGRRERAGLRRSGVQVPRALLRLRDRPALDGERRSTRSSCTTTCRSRPRRTARSRCCCAARRAARRTPATSSTSTAACSSAPRS